jgi:hypothetical protein
MEVFMSIKQKAIGAYVALALFLVEDEVMAAPVQTAGSTRTYLRSMLTDTKFSNAVTIGFAILAFWKWIEFLQAFKADSALRDAITPALLTFLAFSWGDMLTWVGIM